MPKTEILSESRIVNCVFLFLVTVGIALLLYVLNYGVPFAGPIGKLYVESEKWEKLSLKYWVVIDTSDNHNWKEEERMVELAGQDLESLKMTFKTLSSKGSALGNPRPWILKTDKKEWFMELQSPDHAFLCLADDTDWAYSVRIQSTDFHTLLRRMCYDQEKKSNPDIEIENIRICRRFGGNEPPQEHIAPINTSTK